MRDGRFVCPCSVGYGEGGTVGFCVGRLVCADVMIKGWYSSCTALYAKVFLVVACLCLFDFFLVGFLDGFLVGLLLGLLEGYAEYPALGRGLVGRGDGARVGTEVGEEGPSVGARDGDEEVGASEGTRVLGRKVGLVVIGSKLGNFVGAGDGAGDGAVDGAGDGAGEGDGDEVDGRLVAGQEDGDGAKVGIRVEKGNTVLVRGVGICVVEVGADDGILLEGLRVGTMDGIAVEGVEVGR